MAIWHWTECLIYHFNNFAKKCCSKADIEKTDYGFPLVSTRLIRLSLGFHGCQNKPNLSVVYKAACQFAIFCCQKWLIISDVLWWCTMPRKMSLRNNCTFCSVILAGLGDDTLNVDGLVMMMKSQKNRKKEIRADRAGSYLYEVSLSVDLAQCSW